MKKIKFLLGLGVVGAMLTSCVESIHPDNDGNPDGTYTINYGVQVVAVGDVSRGLDGATVTIQTANGVTTKTVGEDGMAVFEGLSAGTISGYVSAPGYASVNFKATAAPSHQDVNTNGYVSSTVYLAAANTNLNGRVYGDFDQDADFTLTDNGNFQAVDVHVKYALAGYPMGAGDGMLTHVSLDVNTYAATSTVLGYFSFTNLPTTDNGHWTAAVRMQDVVVTDANDIQTIYNFGNMGVGLPAGETVEAGDIFAF